MEVADRRSGEEEGKEDRAFAVLVHAQESLAVGSRAHDTMLTYQYLHKTTESCLMTSVRAKGAGRGIPPLKMKIPP